MAGGKKKIETLDEAIQEIATLNSDLDALKIENSNIKAEKETAEANNVELQAIVDDLHGKLKKSDAKEVPSDIIKHKGKKYKVLCSKFNFGNKDRTIEDLRNDEALVTELLKAETNVIKLID